MYRKVHCFFEQSGTFKNEIKKLGGIALDYDILNDFNETDNVIDLYNEIEKAYLDLSSIFNKIDTKDLIIAFFPCVRFEDQIRLMYQGTNKILQNRDDIYKLQNDLYYHKSLSKNYELVTKLAIICLKRKIPLIIENPYSKVHYLTQYWCLKPKIIDMDRTLNGDCFKKPTQYFFIGLEPKQNMVLEPITFVKTKRINEINGFQKDGIVERSMIEPQYAERFLKMYVCDYVDDKYII